MSIKRYVHSSFIHNISTWKQPIRNKCWSIITIKYCWKIKKKKKKELRTYTTRANSSCIEWTQWCPTLCDPMDYTVHGSLQARILEWVAIPFSGGSSQPRDWPQVSCTAGRFEMQKGTYCRVPPTPGPRKQIYGYHRARG